MYKWCSQTKQLTIVPVAGSGTECLIPAENLHSCKQIWAQLCRKQAAEKPSCLSSLPLHAATPLPKTPLQHCCCIVGCLWMLCSSQILDSFLGASSAPQSLFNWALRSAYLSTLGTNVRHLKVPKSPKEQQVFSQTGLWRRWWLSTGSNGQRQGGSANNMVRFMCWVPLSQQMLLQCLMFPSRSITANSALGYVWLHRWRADVPESLTLACSSGIWLS